MACPTERCKHDYAAGVKQIMPLESPELRLSSCCCCQVKLHSCDFVKYYGVSDIDRELERARVRLQRSLAWADTLNGDTYLVFAVGGPAVGALYSNKCGWSNPSGLPAGGTPFFYYVGEWNTPPGPDAFVDAASDTAADTQTLATDLAYYALHGTLPPGVTTTPAPVGPPTSCVGSPS